MRRADVICACKETTFRGMTVAASRTCPVCGRVVYLLSLDKYTGEAVAETPLFRESKLHARVLRVYESQA